MISIATMSYPDSYKSFRRTAGDLPNTIEMRDEKLPKELRPTDVAIKVHAVSLNYRDVAMLIGTYPVPCKQQGIPASDCAAEVVAIGSEVKSFEIGDSVAPITGIGKYEDLDDGLSESLGVDTEGVLREYAVFDQKHLVHLPRSMSWEEASISGADSRRHSTNLCLGVYASMCWCDGMELIRRFQACAQ
jgi:NADPH:quinone reductase-like Zn-dependent oxidoreductase